MRFCYHLCGSPTLTCIQVSPQIWNSAQASSKVHGSVSTTSAKAVSRDNPSFSLTVPEKYLRLQLKARSKWMILLSLSLRPDALPKYSEQQFSVPQEKRDSVQTRTSKQTQTPSFLFKSSSMKTKHSSSLALLSDKQEHGPPGKNLFFSVWASRCKSKCYCGVISAEWRCQSWLTAPLPWVV